MKANNTFFVLALAVAVVFGILYLPGLLGVASHPAATPLSQAIQNDDTDAVRNLIDGGADPNEKFGEEGFTCLHSAIKIREHRRTFYVCEALGDDRKLKANLAIINLLLDHSADPNLQTSSQKSLHDGVCALDLAVIYRDIEMIKLLVGHGGDASRLRKDGTSFIMSRQFIENSDSGDEALLILKEHGLDVLATDRNGKNALHWAAEFAYGDSEGGRGMLSWIKALAKAGVDLNCKDRLGLRPLDWARTVEAAEQIKSLGGKSGIAARIKETH